MSNFSAISRQEQVILMKWWWCPFCTRPTCLVGFL